MKDFGYIDGEFINLYSDENPIMDIGEYIYCLITNDIDYHMPIIAYGIIEHYRITEGQNRVYYVNIHNFLDSPKLINRFITNKAFNIVPFDKDYLQTKKKMQITLNSDFSKYLFPVEAFFCRPSLNQIVTLRNEYFQIIKKDTLQILSDIDDLIYTDIE